MQDTTQIRCDRCKEQVRLKQAEWDKHLLVACNCKEVGIRVSRAMPSEWVSDE